MLKDSKILLSEEDIAKRVKAIGQQISQDYKGKSIVCIGVLKGSFIFLGDLIRNISIPVRVEFIGVSSYSGTTSTGQVRITNDLTSEIRGEHVLLVEDIVDTGTTLDYLLDTFRVRKPKSLKVATFLSKPEAHAMHNKINYAGFEIGREFVVGYGLDLDGKYRELPHILQLLAGA